MTPYILSLVAASIAAAVVELLAPRGQGGRLSAQVRMVAGLFLLVALLVPLKDGLSYLSDLTDGGNIEIPAYEAPDYEATLKASLLSLGSEELSVWVKDILESEFSLSAQNTEVIPVWAEDDELPATLAEVCIVLSGADRLADPHPIETFFSDTLGCPCRVSVAF